MMGGFGGLGMLLWVALIVAAVWWITQLATSQKSQSAAGSSRPSEEPRELLNARLAQGEITVEQHRELRKTLEYGCEGQGRSRELRIAQAGCSPSPTIGGTAWTAAGSSASTSPSTPVKGSWARTTTPVVTRGSRAMRRRSGRPEWGRGFKFPAPSLLPRPPCAILALPTAAMRFRIVEPLHNQFASSLR